ncbi:WxL protein peptidoglycan domain-containing protein [Phytohabitans kaempferiae]|uniref:WxL protein peptidoglycan domain-containing protein n=1 Tax=Phytohabitans kaempferiae TaxID=1620943 RepID=A0ABV6M8U0_9ACTN
MRVLLSMVAVLVGVLPAGAVAAAPAPAPAPSASASAPTVGAAPLTWGVAPSTRKGPDGRAAFNYKLDPGAELTDYAGISNYSGQPITVDLYASDAFTTPSGGFDLLPAAQEPTDVGTWVAFESRYRRLVIPSKSRVDVPFRLTVPRNATPGDHAGGIVASIAEPGTDAGGNRVRVDRRVGARIYLRVTGELAPAFTVERLDAGYDGTFNPLRGGTVTATYRVRNTGNVRLTGTPRVEVAGPFGIGRRSAGAAALPEILPGGEYTATVQVRGAAPLFRLDVDFGLSPVAVNASMPVPAATGHTAVWAWPWPQAVLLLLLAAGVWLLLYRRRAHARALATARAEGRAEATTSPETGPELSDANPTKSRGT